MRGVFTKWRVTVWAPYFENAPHKGVLPYNLLGKAYSWATLGGHSETALITTPSGSRS